MSTPAAIRPAVATVYASHRGAGPNTLALGLSRSTGCGVPSGPVSVGAEWLVSIFESIALDAESGDIDFNDPHVEDVPRSYGEMVPLDAHIMWQVFADLSAWREDTSDSGSTTLDNLARFALASIAERLAAHLIDSIRTEAEAWDAKNADGTTV